MSYTPNKKYFSKELLNFLEIDDKPYYITYIYKLFFCKIDNLKKYQSYVLTNELRELIGVPNWHGKYFSSAFVKRSIRNNHIIYNSLPNDIYSMNISDITQIVHMITI